jgi:hypothetical protein
MPRNHAVSSALGIEAMKVEQLRWLLYLAFVLGLCGILGSSTPLSVAVVVTCVDWMRESRRAARWRAVTWGRVLAIRYRLLSSTSEREHEDVILGIWKLRRLGPERISVKLRLPLSFVRRVLLLPDDEADGNAGIPARIPVPPQPLVGRA